ncbi:MAG: glycosyltransferase family 9 protein, partial [Candidatus Krumholzibacteria bacterium]|nr:glycosyltransferase family 9 protein [Candidatus Krumholzibacteria bacterium]
MESVSLPARKGVPLRILVTRLRYLGDVILTTPVIDVLQVCFPEAEIWYMAEPPHMSILENHPGLAGVIEVDGTLSTIRKLRKLRFAAAIDLFYNPRSANILRLSNIPVRIGGGRKWRRRLYTHIFEGDRNIRNAICQHLSAVRVLGCEPVVRRPRIYLSAAELESGRNAVEA